jgi:chromosome segregation ATPase
VLILCNVFAAYSQDLILIGEIKKSTLQIDSLQKELVSAKGKNDSLNKNTTELQKQVKELEKELNGLKKFKEQKKITDQQLQQKNDSIVQFVSEIAKKDAEIKNEQADGKQKANEKYREGQQSITAGILKDYHNKPFDGLIKISTAQSVRRDYELSVNGNDSASKLVLSDLRAYFDAKELLEKKFDEKQINAVLSAPTIKRQSELFDKLKKNLEAYRDFNDGLKETIEKIVSIDERNKVAGMDNDIQKLKFYDIMSEISLYLFNYDFNFVDYPWLSDIVLEIIKRKQPDPDANISDLLNKIKY